MSRLAVPDPVGELTGLPLSRFAMAELVAKATRAGCTTLWEYVELLEHAVDNPPGREDLPRCLDPTHDELLAYARHDDDCTIGLTFVCSCGFAQVTQ